MALYVQVFLEFFEKLYSGLVLLNAIFKLPDKIT